MKNGRSRPMLPLSLLGGSLWAIRDRVMLEQVLHAARFALEVRGNAVPADAQAAAIVGESAPAGPRVAVLTLTGVLTPHGSMLSWLFGGDAGGVQAFRDQLSRAVADPDVAAIVLDVDSPGGSVGLVPEAAADVRSARDVKPVYAVANTLAASGAYYIASQATELYVTPSGMVGSIGVYYLHEDWSSANEKIGIDVTYVYAGRYKTEGNPDEPLTDEARAAWQADADTLYAQFVDDVALGRGVSADKVRSDYGEGRVLLAGAALDAGMVNGIDTLQAVVGRALSDAAASTGPSARRLGHATATARAAHAVYSGDDTESDDDGDPALDETLAADAEHVPADARPVDDRDAGVDSDVGPDAPAPTDPPPDRDEAAAAAADPDARAAIAAVLLA